MLNVLKPIAAKPHKPDSMASTGDAAEVVKSDTSEKARHSPEHTSKSMGSSAGRKAFVIGIVNDSVVNGNTHASASPKPQGKHTPTEQRVAATPETIRSLVSIGVEIVVETNAGMGAHISNEDFQAAGARIVDTRRDVFQSASVVLCVSPLNIGDHAFLNPHQVVIGVQNPLHQPERWAKLATTRATVLALDWIPRISRAQSMDVLSSQANVAGYWAAIEAARRFHGLFPMLMTAAGTIPAAKVFVIGAGVMGLQAIATAKRLGAIVSATDVRPAAREEIESLGAKFVGLVIDQAQNKQGYARQLTDDERNQQSLIVQDHIAKQNVVITTAVIPNKPAPRLVTRAMLDTMRGGSVIIDMAVQSGGNVEGSLPSEAVNLPNGVCIVGAGNAPSDLAPVSSLLYARNLLALTRLIIAREEDVLGLRLDMDDDILKSTTLVHQGQIVHPQLAPAPSPTSPSP